MNIHDRARLLAAQSPHPTTVREQLSKLSKRRHYGRTTVKRDGLRAVESPAPRYWWQEGGQ